MENKNKKPDYTLRLLVIALILCFLVLGSFFVSLGVGLSNDVDEYLENSPENSFCSLMYIDVCLECIEDCRELGEEYIKGKASSGLFSSTETECWCSQGRVW